MSVCYECYVLSGRGLCDELITSPEESHRLRCVVVCDLETSRMRRPWPALSRSATGKKTFWKSLEIVIYNFVFQLYPSTPLTNFSILVCPHDDLVKVKICRRNISENDYLFFIIYCEICFIKHCIASCNCCPGSWVICSAVQCMVEQRFAKILTKTWDLADYFLTSQIHLRYMSGTWNSLFV